jgi:DNA-binding response OmpR family regulator
MASILLVDDDRAYSRTIAKVLFLLELRAASISPKTLMVSGGSLLEKGEVLTLAGALGVEAVLEKPFELGELMDRVEKILESG